MASELVSQLGAELLGKSGMVTAEEALSGKTHIMLYFSAHWCPPCRGFTPQLAKQYSASAAEKNIEVVFISSDRDEASFNDYYGEMPWLALPFDARGLKQSLSEKYEIRGIPSLVVLDGEGNLVTANGRAEVNTYFG
eukprot:TRINITY_DN559_c0_g1_i2.p1 TRINITY_DN559_c0_g1~~TRINITY_DN559_c0_g1_i2.p1  ORF type:complete len:157 (+),score=25.65 TRINITY_DN559_c0_g1_i2:61-471(+)